MQVSDPIPQSSFVRLPRDRIHSGSGPFAQTMKAFVHHRLAEHAQQRTKPVFLIRRRLSLQCEQGA
jgi:hypothetical protein